MIDPSGKIPKIPISRRSSPMFRLSGCVALDSTQFDKPLKGVKETASLLPLIPFKQLP